MEDTQADRDEEELQEILEKAPDPATIRCIFCDKPSTTYVEIEDLDLDPNDFDGEEMLPVCIECWPEEDGLFCIDCLVGNFCSDHMTEEEYSLRKILLETFDAYDDEEIDDDDNDDDLYRY